MKINSKNTSKNKGGKTKDWDKVPGLEPAIDDSPWDSHLSFASPEVMESLGNQFFSGEAGEAAGDFFSRAKVSHLKNVRFDLGRLDLTDRQLMAVSLVYYGGVKKNRAARAMSISSQAVTDHLNAALKKIGRSLK